MRIGICGAGFVAQAHAHGYAAQPDARIAVVVDPRLEHAEEIALAGYESARTGQRVALPLPA
jgi:predicted dehydrogenase